MQSVIHMSEMSEANKDTFVDEDLLSTLIILNGIGQEFFKL
jgi:hypothetical protein